MPDGPVAHRRRLRPLAELTRARLLEFVREPSALFWVFVFPVLLAVALGIAFRTKPPEAARVAVSGDWGTRLVRVLDRAEGLQPVPLGRDEAAAAVRSGDTDLAATLDEGSDGRPVLELLYDPERPGAKAAARSVDDALQRALGRKDVVRVERQEVSERGARYIDFLLPGLIGLNLMGSSMWAVGFAVVQTRVRKLLKRFAATPMHRSDYLLALILSRVVFLVAELVALLAAGDLIFGIEVRGSWLGLGAVALLGGLSFTGLALLIAARTTTTEAANGWMNFVMLPMWVLSGSFFSYARFPASVQPAIRALPLTALNDALRAIMNQGAAFAGTWPQMAVLAIWGIGGFVVALKIFKWQ
jgi:ABC-type multidrug transport system permease subunit